MVTDQEKPEGSLIKRVLRSKVFVVVAVLVFVVMAYFLSRVIAKKYEVAQEIKAIKERRETLVKENQRLQDMLAYLKTDAYQEKAARENLGLQKSGETVVAVEEKDSDIVRTEEEFMPATAAATPPAYLPIFKKWYNYFFASQD